MADVASDSTAGSSPDLASTSAASAASPSKSKAARAKKTPAKLKKPSTHPKYSIMIRDAIGALKERGGSSRQALLKYIVANFNVGKGEKTVNSHLKLALRAGIKNGSLRQSKGTGASGSFRLGEKAGKAAATASVKPKTEQVKNTKAAKPATKEKPAKAKKAKKSPAKEKKNKSPKKAAGPKKAKLPAKKAATNAGSPKPKKSPKKTAVKKSPKKIVKKAAAKK